MHSSDMSGNPQLELGGTNAALIIDDDPIHIEVARALLAAVHFTRIEAAEDGQKAVAILAKEGPFDLIMLDLNMPDYDGVEFLEHLRSVAFSKPVVICSGADQLVRAGAELLGKAYNLNILAMIAKPLTHDKLAAAISSAC